VAVLLEMLAPHVSGGRVRLLQPCVPVRADTVGDRVTPSSSGTLSPATSTP
jgi:hypothetical protein